MSKSKVGCHRHDEEEDEAFEGLKSLYEDLFDQLPDLEDDWHASAGLIKVFLNTSLALVTLLERTKRDPGYLKTIQHRFDQLSSSSHHE